ncbi:hypothetical protein KCU99_g234, partial [Aureobasidium melanogenum]
MTLLRAYLTSQTITSFARTMSPKLVPSKMMHPLSSTMVYRLFKVRQLQQSLKIKRILLLLETESAGHALPALRQDSVSLSEVLSFVSQRRGIDVDTLLSQATPTSSSRSLDKTKRTSARSSGTKPRSESGNVGPRVFLSHNQTFS